MGQGHSCAWECKRPPSGNPRKLLGGQPGEDVRFGFRGTIMASVMPLGGSVQGSVQPAKSGLLKSTSDPEQHEPALVDTVITQGSVVYPLEASHTQRLDLAFEIRFDVMR